MTSLLSLAALALVGGVALAWTVTIMSRRPVVGAGLVAAVTGLVGVWVTPPLPLYVPPATLVCLLVVLVMSVRYSWRPTGGDLVVYSSFVLVALSPVLGATVNSVLGDLVLAAAPAYLAGKMLVERIGLERVAEPLCVVWAIAALMGLIEAVTAFNPFLMVKVPGPLYEGWAQVQMRAGTPRIEGAFGHSIAFATCMAAMIPLVSVTRWPAWLRMGVMTLLLAATMPSLSRTGIMCAFIGYVLSLLFLPSSLGLGWRFSGLAAITLGALAALPVLFSVFAEAGDEQSGSAEYRGDILSLVPQLRMLGVSPSRGMDGANVTWGGFKSIDDQLLLAALRFGWLPVVILMAALLVLAVRTLRVRANAAQVALVCLIPAYLTVAFITQLPTVVWLLAGMAVAQEARTRAAGAGGAVRAEPQRGIGTESSGSPPRRA